MQPTNRRLGTKSNPLEDLEHSAHNTKQPKASNKDNLGVNHFVRAHDFGHRKTIPSSKGWLYRSKQPFGAMKKSNLSQEIR
jgi:hypothetical protein